MTAVLVEGQVRCETCNAPYRPRLTGWTCPVCDAPPPVGTVRRPRLSISPDDRLMAIVFVGTLLNVLLLGLLTAFALHR
ncbi:MAG: hypothetical protein JWP11_511 [Frankiales bacterium]|jgi:hypothetical protein|nr:hypothetical protein [Frankiales bacterium]